jgi:ABC-type transporter Mla subunit MlaD
VRRGSPARTLAATGIVLALVAIAVIVFFDDTNAGLSIRLGLGIPTGPGDHWIQTVVPEATGVIPGERVTAAAQTAGYVVSAKVTRHGDAHIVMDIDNSVWPLPRDSTLTLRMGGTIKYTDRYVSITKGHARQSLANGGHLPAGQFIVPVEYDSLFNTFDAPTRAGMSSLLDNAGQALPPAAAPLRRALADSAPALEQSDSVFQDLGYDTAALATLVSASNRVLGAVAQSNPGLKTLLTGAAETFGAVSSQDTALRQSIQQAPATLVATRDTLARADQTLNAAGRLTDTVAPGVSELRVIAQPLVHLLDTVKSVAPVATTTLNTVRGSAPSIDALLGTVRSPVLPRLQSIGRRGARQLGCIRPYTPEILGVFSTWASIWALGDSTGKFLHVLHGPEPLPSDTPNDSGAEGKLLPTLQMDFPQVPGAAVDQPWYQPQCGITASSFNLADDPEASSFDPLSKTPIQFTSAP